MPDAKESKALEILKTVIGMAAIVLVCALPRQKAARLGKNGEKTADSNTDQNPQAAEISERPSALDAIASRSEPADDPSQRNQPRDCEKHTSGWQRFNVITQAAFSAALVGVGLVQICIFRYQTDAMRTANDLNARINRPFVYITNVYGSYSTSGTDLIANVQPVWSNSGNTPTVDLSVYKSAKAFKDPLPKNFNFPDLDVNGHEIGSPSVVRTLLPPKGNTPAMDSLVTGEQMKSVNDGTVLYEWGWARYKDRLNSESGHITRFCVAIGKFIAPTREQLTVPAISQGGAIQWKFCDQGNCADEECEKQ
jgi:hypothetical protein